MTVYTLDKELKEGEIVELVGEVDLTDNTAQCNNYRYNVVTRWWTSLHCFDYLPRATHQKEYAAWLN